MSKSMKSDKLHLIDRVTFEHMQQCQSGSGTTAAAPRIRNSKYKRTRSDFNLFHFVKPRQHTLKGKRPVLLLSRKPIKKRGKTREGGKRKKVSRLKKSILRYRAQRSERVLQTNLNEVAQQMEALKLTHSKTKDTSEKTTAAIVHSRRFRRYCDNCTTPRLSQLSEQLLRELHRFQKRAYAQNEIKAHAHRRFVVGFREVQNFLRINKVKLAIIAPDCEECVGEAGIDETITSMKTQCQSQQIPYAFALRRRQLAYALYKKVPVSCVAILDYDGARQLFADLIDALNEARSSYALLQQPQDTQ